MDFKDILSNLAIALGIIGGIVLWYLQARQASLEIEVLKKELEDRDEKIEKQNQVIKIIQPDDVLVLRPSKPTYDTDFTKLDPQNMIDVFDPIAFEEMDDRELVEYAKIVKKILDSYPSGSKFL